MSILASASPIRRSKMGWMAVLYGLPPIVQPMVRDAYTAPGRHYHDAQHLGGIWDTWVALRGMGDRVYDDGALLWATAFHDIVYDPLAPKGVNETNSANRLAEAMAMLDDDPGSKYWATRPGEEVIQMILATQDHLTAGDGMDDPATILMTRLFCDLDLSGLAADWKGFTESSRLIRLEYPHLSDAEYAAGRRQFFREFQAAPRIYRSNLMPDWWEGQARSNIAKMLAADPEV